MTEVPERRVDDSQPLKPVSPRRERPRFPLALKLFLLVALLIVIVVSLAVGITLRRANTIALDTVGKSIKSASMLFRELERDRLARLQLGAQPIASNPNFVAYIEHERSQLVGASSLTDGVPAGTADIAAQPESGAEPQPPVLTPDAVASILDLLQTNRESIGSDLLLVTDADGYVLGRTDQSAVTAMAAEDLYKSEPLLKEYIDGGDVEPVTGIISTGGRLYHAVIAPLAVGPNWVRKGYLISALAIDEGFANRISESTNASVLFAGTAAGGRGDFASRSTDAPSANAFRGLPEFMALVGKGTPIAPRTVKIDRSAYLLTGEPLKSGGRQLGAAVFVRSLDRELAPYKEIEKTLWMAGGASLLFALLLSFLLASRLTKPIADLAGMAQAVTAGDYSVNPQVRTGDEVGILASSFGKMVTALRDKAELESLYEQMSTRLKEKETGTLPLRKPAQAEEATILVTELRGIEVSSDPADAERVVAQITAAMRLQESEIRRQEGQVREIVGQRLIATFEGDRGVTFAVRAARAIVEELASPTGTAPLTAGCGIAKGEFVSGGMSVSTASGTALAGNAPQLALLFAWEAPNGHAFVALDAAQAAGNEILASGVRDEVRLRWLPAPVAVCSLSLKGLVTGITPPGPLTGAAATLVLDGSSPRIPIQGDLTPGMTFASRYQIEQIIGRGGMGVVYRAVDTQLDETVALKMLPNDALTRSPEELDRFKREIRLARRITHRNVLRTYDYGEADGAYFISMEYVRGYTLAELLMENRVLALRAALGIGRQICRGLHAAHEQGIIHRDIKPQNVLIDPKGEVKLMDFGIARMTESVEAMTAAGLIVGTPHYMSPEQVQGKSVDARSDVYSMGIMLYEMIAGSRPFDAPSLTAILAAHLTAPAKPLIEIRPDAGDELNSIVLRCLNKDPRHRYADAGELLRDLDRVRVAA
jgi:serine/threonine-protein kinase